MAPNQPPPELPVYPPHSIWARLLEVISSIKATGIIAVGDMQVLAEGFELRHTPEDAGWVRFLWAVSKASTIRP